MRSGSSALSVKPMPYSVTPLSERLRIHLHLLSAKVASEDAATTNPASMFTFYVFQRAIRWQSIKSRP